MKNLGFIGYPKYAVTKEGRVWSLFSNKLLSEKKMLGEYPAVTLCNDVGRKEEFVHRLVARCYCEGYEEGLWVNHKDGNKRNNHYTNLEWVTPKENTRHAMDTGLMRTEVINDYRSYSDQLVHLICKMLDEGARNKDIAEALDVDAQKVADIKCGYYYKDISQEYNFRKIPSSNRIQESKVISICEHLADGSYTTAKIARLHGVSFYTVGRIKERKTYTYLSNNFDW